jgi:hypothetical protein
MTTNKFQMGQTVKGKVAGTFLVMHYQNIGGEEMVRLKPIDAQTGKELRGTVCLPEHCLTLA